MTDFLQETRGRVRRRVGRLLYPELDQFVYGTATSGSSSTLASTSDLVLVPDESYIGWVCSIHTGTGAGQSRIVTNSVQATGVLSVSPNWTTPPDNTSQFELWPSYAIPVSINDAIDLAILRASDIVNVYVESAAVIASDRMSVTLPAGLVKVVGVRYQDGYGLWHDVMLRTDQYQDPLGFESAVLAGSTIYLSRALDASNLLVKVRGYRLPALPTTDSDLLEVRSDYVAFMAAYNIDAGLAYGQAADPEQHSARASNWFNQAKDIELRMGTRWLPNTIAIEM